LLDIGKNNVITQTTLTENCTALFENWFKTILLPTVPNDTVSIMDNARFHRKLALGVLLQNYSQSKTKLNFSIEL